MQALQAAAVRLTLTIWFLNVSEHFGTCSTDILHHQISIHSESNYVRAHTRSVCVVPSASKPRFKVLFHFISLKEHAQCITAQHSPNMP